MKCVINLINMVIGEKHTCDCIIKFESCADDISTPLRNHCNETWPGPVHINWNSLVSSTYGGKSPFIWIVWPKMKSSIWISDAMQFRKIKLIRLDVQVKRFGVGKVIMKDTDEFSNVLLNPMSNTYEKYLRINQVELLASYSNNWLITSLASIITQLSTIHKYQEVTNHFGGLLASISPRMH